MIDGNHEAAFGALCKERDTCMNVTVAMIYNLKKRGKETRQMAVAEENYPYYGQCQTIQNFSEEKTSTHELKPC